LCPSLPNKNYGFNPFCIVPSKKKVNLAHGKALSAIPGMLLKIHSAPILLDQADLIEVSNMLTPLCYKFASVSLSLSHVNATSDNWQTASMKIPIVL